MKSFVREQFEDFIKEMDIPEDNKDQLYFFWKYGWAMALVNKRQEIVDNIENDIDELMGEDD